MDKRIVTVDLEHRSYDIYIGADLIYRIADFIPQELEGRKVFIVTDRNVLHYAQKIEAVLSAAGAGFVSHYAVDAGEQSKSFEVTQKVCHWLLQNDVSRDSLIVAVGGGVIGDLAGFCASIIMRGIDFVQVPTTLLAQVDSSVGGKTGINTPYGKNTVGCFYQPSAVIADTTVLATLPGRELLAGYAEIAKYGLINDSGFFGWLEVNGQAVVSLDRQALAHAIETSVRAKAVIVNADERESGQRALLNLGHTFGHALETAAEYDGRLLHGEAVSIGIVMAFDLSSRMGLCSRDDYERVEDHFSHIGLPVRAEFIDPSLKTTPEALLAIMKRDKKAVGGKMRFIVASGIGHSYISDDVPEQLVLDVLRSSLSSK